MSPEHLSAHSQEVKWETLLNRLVKVKGKVMEQTCRTRLDMARVNNLRRVLYLILHITTLCLQRSSGCDLGETNPPFHSLSLPPLLQVLENFRIEVQNLSDVGTKFGLLLLPEKPIFFNFQPLKKDMGTTMITQGGTV